MKQRSWSSCTPIRGQLRPDRCYLDLQGKVVVILTISAPADHWTESRGKEVPHFAGPAIVAEYGRLLLPYGTCTLTAITCVIVQYMLNDKYTNYTQP